MSCPVEPDLGSGGGGDSSGFELFSTPVRKKLRLTNIRIASQIFFFTVFILLCWLTWTSRLEGYPVSRILEMDPLVTISTMLSTGYVYRYLGWGLLVLGLTLLAGRVF